MLYLTNRYNTYIIKLMSKTIIKILNEIKELQPKENSYSINNLEIDIKNILDKYLTDKSDEYNRKTNNNIKKIIPFNNQVPYYPHDDITKLGFNNKSYTYQPNGNQSSPDFIIFIDNTFYIIEAKSSKTSNVPQFNSHLPLNNWIYIFTYLNNKNNDKSYTTYFMGQDIIKYINYSLFKDFTIFINACKNIFNKKINRSHMSYYDRGKFDMNLSLGDKKIRNELLLSTINIINNGDIVDNKFRVITSKKENFNKEQIDSYETIIGNYIFSIKKI